MGDTSSRLYEKARLRLEEEFPGTSAKRPTSPLWRIFDPELANALSIPGVLAYVVERPFVTSEDLDTARSIASDVVPTGRIIIFALENSVVEPDVTEQLHQVKEEVRLIAC